MIVILFSANYCLEETPDEKGRSHDSMADRDPEGDIYLSCKLLTFALRAEKGRDEECTESGCSQQEEQKITPDKTLTKADRKQLKNIYWK